MKKYNILLKKIAFNLNENEEVLFQEWLQKSEKNKLLYEKLLLIKKEKKHFEKFSDLDTNAAWKRVQEKSSTKQKNKPISLFNRRKFTIAAASVLILISVTLLYKNTNVFNSTITPSTPTIVNNNIKTGTNKAILTLGSGLKVVLKKGSSYKTTNSSSDGVQLIYQVSKKASPEIEYNYLTVPRGGQFFVTLSDGTQVWLNSGSQIKYPVEFIEGETRKVELVYGEAYFDVSPSTEHLGAAFKVYNVNQEVEVLGTEFNIKAYNDEANVYTTLIEGKVAINYQGKRQYLKPNQQSNLDLRDNSLKISTIEVNTEISWKEGVFNFNSKRLKDIMVVLSRWYDMDVVFDDKELENQKFVGLINKNHSIEDILSVMKDTNIINSFVINNKTITLK